MCCANGITSNVQPRRLCAAFNRSHFEDQSEDEFVRALAKLEPDDRAVLILVCHAKLFAFHPRAVEIVTGKALQS